MQNDLSTDPEHYNELVARQIDQYKETELMHDLPPIYDYVAKKYTAPYSHAVVGHTSLIRFYAHNFRKSLEESDSNFLASFGAGDCWLEIEIVKELVANNIRKFFFICFELSPILIGKARKKIDEEQLGDLITVAQIDLNKWDPGYSFAGVMAHHALHHFLYLEQFFESIKKKLAPHGRFVTCDIIGRNGHMRWPEALQLTRKIWERIPRKYKYNWQFQQYEDYYENRDCSNEGFEGIRAQDILPLLVKMFSFEVFFSSGNLIDPFIDRSFGPNFDPANPVDTAFIDYLQELNDQLISDGILKPTSMIAVMVNEPIAQTRIYKHWDPAFAVRDPEGSAPAYDIGPLLEKIPYRLAPEDDPYIFRQIATYPLGVKSSFGNAKNAPHPKTITGISYLTFGWGRPEPHYTWSISEDAGLIFPLATTPDSDLVLDLEFISYRSTLFAQTVINIIVNDSSVETLSYPSKEKSELTPVKIRLPASLIRGRKSIEIIFRLPGRRQPQFEPGEDVRSVGIALVSATISIFHFQADKRER